MRPPLTGSPDRSRPAISAETEINLLAIVMLLLIAALAWTSRGSLNVDGVSYLDLASRLRQGDWSGFVQGYWSPAYPALLAVVLALTATGGAAAAIMAHDLNALIGFGGVLLLWLLARRRGDRVFARLAFAAFLLCSARTPRVDAVTPDLLLIAVMIGLAAELLRGESTRGWVLGMWLGAAFLVKTSTWPWLLVATPLVIMRRRPGMTRLRWALPVLGGVALLVGGWVTAMSVDAGMPTLGGTGRLNLCWYVLRCDGRSPDTHRGDHRDYRDFEVDGRTIGRLAEVDGEWTYAPWSDPVAWQAGVTAQRAIKPTIRGFVLSVAIRAGLVVGWWALHLLLAVLVPLGLVTRPRLGWRDVLRTPSGALMLLGVVGVAPFLVVHAEPRLIAPYLMLASLGWISWRLDGARRRGFAVATWLGLATALPRGVWHMADQQRVTDDTTLRMSRLLAGHPPAGAPYRVAVIGPAMPLVPDLYRVRARVVAQLFEPSTADVRQWPVDAQRALQAELRRRGATEVWLSRGGGAYGIVSLGP